MKITHVLVSTCLVGWVGVAGVVHAQPAPAEETVAETPGFVTMDRADAHSFIDAGAGITFFDGDDPDFNARLDLYGQYVTPQGAGGYVSLPISFLMDDDSDISETALGNVELGGLYVLRQSPKLDVALRGGLMLATADDDDMGQVTNLITAFGRLTDLASAFSDVTWLRLAASPLYRSGNVFLRADAGLDVAVDKPEGSDVDPLARINLGAGFTNGSIAGMAELVMLGTTGDVDEDEDRFIETLALSFRGGLGGGVQGYCALVLPLDNDITDGIDYILTLGMRIPIPR